MKFKQHLLIIYWLLLLLCASVLHAEDVSIRVRMNPVDLPVGQYGFYQVEVRGSINVEAPRLPKIHGLEIQYAGPQRSIINENGNVQSKITFAYRVVAHEMGDYVIPQYTIRVGQQDYTVPAVEIHAISQIHAQQGQTISGHFLQGHSFDSEDIEPYLEIEMPSDYIYVGEAVPCTIKLYCPQGTLVMPRGLSFPAHDVFTATTLRNPSERSVTGENGEPMTEYSWITVLTPIKEGQFTLGFTLDAVVSNPLKTANGEMLFGRWPSMVQHMLNSDEMQMSTPELKVTVAAFPKENQPKNFAGAIGQFTLRALDIPVSVEVGEPISLRLELEGTGNFERIQALELNFPKDQWRVYPPKVSFDAKDEFGLIGIKRFEYIIIPQSTTVKEVPEINFSFFNHTYDAYQEIKIPARMIEVKPSSQQVEDLHVVSQQAESAVSVAQKIEDLKSQKSDGSTFNLIPNKPNPGKVIKQQLPFYRNYWLMIMQLVLLVVLVVLLKKGIVYRKGRLNPEWLVTLRLKKEIIELEGDLQKAYKHQDAVEYWVFFDRLIRLHMRRVLKKDVEVNESKNVLISFIQEETSGVIDAKELNLFFERIEKLKFAGGLSGEEAKITQEVHNAVQLIVSRLQGVAS